MQEKQDAAAPRIAVTALEAAVRESHATQAIILIIVGMMEVLVIRAPAWRIAYQESVRLSVHVALEQRRLSHAAAC